LASRSALVKLAGAAARRRPRDAARRQAPPTAATGPLVIWRTSLKFKLGLVWPGHDAWSGAARRL